MMSWSITTTGVPCSLASDRSCFVVMPVGGSIHHRLGAVDHFNFVVKEVFLGQRFHHFVALIVYALELARFVFGQGVMGKNRHGDGGISIANHGIGQAIWIDFA